MKFAYAGLCVSAVFILIISGCAAPVPAPVSERSAIGAGRLPSGAPAKESYVVKRGDTLYSIALDNGLDYKDLRDWNGLGDANHIRVGQVLKLIPPETSASPSAIAIVNPVGLAGVVERRSLDENTPTLKREPKGGKLPYSDAAYELALKGPTGSVTPMPAPIEPKAEAKPEPRSEPPVAAKASEGSDEPKWIWPASGKVLAGFADGKSKGIDISGRIGDPVVAASDGKVAYIGGGIPSYGQLLIIKHSAAFLTAYAHNSKILVKEGQVVSRGQKVAEMGNTGTDDVKLHFEVRHQGSPVDPLKYLPPR